MWRTVAKFSSVRVFHLFMPLTKAKLRAKNLGRYSEKVSGKYKATPVFPESLLVLRMYKFPKKGPTLKKKKNNFSLIKQKT